MPTITVELGGAPVGLCVPMGLGATPVGGLVGLGVPLSVIQAVVLSVGHVSLRSH